MKNRIKILLFVLGAYVTIFSIANFHCHKNYASDYINLNSTEAKSDPADISSETKTAPRKIVDPKHIDSNTSKIWTSKSDTLEKTNSIRYEVIDYNTRSESRIAYESSTSAVLYDQPPAAGHGKLAIRSYCDYCQWDLVEVQIFYGDSADSRLTPILANYDSLKKNSSKIEQYGTFKMNLLPGRYRVGLEYHWQGIEFFTVDVFEGRTTLYHFPKENPFGKYNGQIAFRAGNLTRKCEITVDDKYLGIVTIYKDKDATFILPAGEHIYKAFSVNPTKVDKDSIFQKFTLHRGEKKILPIF